jgi:hypothetical protein
MRLSLGYVLVYSVRMKRIKMAQRVKVMLMDMGIRYSHIICMCEHSL